jgi:ATP-dependent exoDNAse (exonuclease V) beta subunit
VWTHFGSLVHKYIQAVLIDEPVPVAASLPWRTVTLEPMQPEKAAKDFIRTWFRFCRFYSKQISEQHPGLDVKNLYKSPVRAIMGVRDMLKKEFGEYKLLAVELKLREPTKYPQQFSGFIDIIIQLPDETVVVIDLKTTSSHYMFTKFQDKYKDYQLTLYKHFYAAKNSIDPKNVETYFLTLTKDPKSKEPLKLIRVTSGPKKVKNALAWLNGVLSSVEREMFVKNRLSCDNFYGSPCPFKNTEHCT